jgi:uncharacterized repeat protein (TIGR04076 family)
MIKDENKKLARQMLGMSEEDMEKVTPGMEEDFINAMPLMAKYRLVAEVVSSKYCYFGLKPGQKIVLDDTKKINTQESTAPLCLHAIVPFIYNSKQLIDRIYRKADPTARMVGFRCIDPGIELGGLGGVEFKVKVEEK